MLHLLETSAGPTYTNYSRQTTLRHSGLQCVKPLQQIVSTNKKSLRYLEVLANRKVNREVKQLVR